MMNKLPALQFYPGDWRRDPGVQSLTFEERGIWIELLFLMHESEQRGKLVLNGRAASTDRLARMLHIDPEKLETVIETLLDLGVASRCPETGALMNRRMVRDEAIRHARSRAGLASSTKRQQTVNKPLNKTATNVQQTGQQTVNKPLNKTSTNVQQTVNKISTNGQQTTQQNVNKTSTKPQQIFSTSARDADPDEIRMRPCIDECVEDDIPCIDVSDDISDVIIADAADAKSAENREIASIYAGESDFDDAAASTKRQQTINKQVNKMSTNCQQTGQQNANKTPTNRSTKSGSSSSASASIYSSLSYTEREARTSGREPPKRGTRLPEPFIVTDEMRSWARERCPDADLDLETEKFVNYWSAKAGRDAIKLDWRRTWQNWLLRADEFRRTNRSDTNGNYRRTSRDRLAAHAAILERYPDECEPSEAGGDADGAAQTLVN